MLLLGAYVTDHANDKRELNPAVQSVAPDVRLIDTVCADTGYFSEEAVKTTEAEGKGAVVFCAMEKQGHHRTVEDLERKSEPEAPRKQPPSRKEWRTG